jgi:DNA-binding NtrC family response regulator
MKTKKTKKNILIIDDDVNISLKYKKWLENDEERGFNLTLITDPLKAESDLKSNATSTYDLILISLKMSIIDKFNLYNKIHERSLTTTKKFRVCFLTSSLRNFNALSEVYPGLIEKEKECYVPKQVPKDIFLKHVYAVITHS